MGGSLFSFRGWYRARLFGGNRLPGGGTAFFSVRKRWERTGRGRYPPAPPPSTPQRAGLKSLQLQKCGGPKAMAVAYEVLGEPGGVLSCSLPTAVEVGSTHFCGRWSAVSAGGARRGNHPCSPSGVFFLPSFFSKRKRDSRRTGGPRGSKRKDSPS